MYIVTAIPLDYIPKEAGETFSFFSAQPLSRGALIKANIKKRLIKLLVWESKPLKDYKASVRKSDFPLSPVVEVLSDKSFLKETHYELARYLGSYYHEAWGTYLKLLFPLKAYKQLQKNNIFLPDFTSPVHSNSGHNLEYWQEDNFFSSLKDLIHNRHGQIAIICPTITHLQYLEKYLATNYPDIPLIVYHKSTTIKDSLTFYKKFTEVTEAIVIGLQSTIFLPFFNLDTIVVYNYKHRGQFSIDQHPYYLTTKVAAIWSKLTNCRLVLTAALPDLELAKLSSEYLKQLPTFKNLALEIVDLKSLSVETKSKIVLSPSALIQVQKAYTQHKRVLIFLNRKGLAHYIICRDCGQVPCCPHCQKALTLKEDGAGRELICRECGYKTVVPEICPHCHSWHLKAVGLGVEAIEKQLLDNLFPSQSINLISRDELENDVGLESLLQKITPITIATEIIFKPQTLPFDLTVVVNSDSLLNATNYLASEELINCIAQLKKLTQEKIILQTFEPQNDFWDYWKQKPIADFYKDEIENRKIYHYPPFAHIVRITLGNKNKTTGSHKANDLVTFLQTKTNKMSQEKRELFDVLGPIPESHSNSQSIFFWEIIIKLNTDSISLRDHLLEGVSGRNINLEIDPPLGV